MSEEHDGEGSAVVCPVCGGRDTLRHVDVKAEVSKPLFMPIAGHEIIDVIDEGFLRSFVFCKECGRVVFSRPVDRVQLAKELLEKDYSYTFKTVDAIPEGVRSIILGLFNEARKCSELMRQYYGSLVDAPQKVWDRVFGLDDESIPRVSIGEGVVSVFLGSGSVHVADNNGETRVMVVYGRNEDETLSELARPEVVKLMEEVKARLRRESAKIEAHIALESLLE
jgi:hypothetical protein